MTHQQIEHFFSSRPALTVAGVAKELKVSRQFLHRVRLGEQNLSPEKEKLLKEVMMKYGFSPA